VTGYLNTGDPGTSYQTTIRFDARHRETEVDGPEILNGASANRKTTFSYFDDTDLTLNLRGRPRKTSLYTSISASLDTQFDNYDIFGTAKKIVDPNNVETDKMTDQKGRVTTVVSKKPSGDASEPGDYTTTYAYDLLDRLTKVTLPGPSPSGNQIQYVYEDGTNRLTDTIRADSTVSHNQQERLHMTLNVIGDKVQEDAQLCSSPDNPCLAGNWTTKRTDSFTYDAHNRLQKVTHPGPGATHVDYTYDSRGNLKTIQDENHSAANTTYGYDSLNRLTSVTQTLAGAPTVSGSALLRRELS
jgi:YD repeat-containing protein